MPDIYQPGQRPRCAVCNEELDPAPSANDGEPTVRGFLPCPQHPRAPVVYPDGEVVPQPTW